MNFLPKMDYKVLIEGYKKIIRDIYEPKAYYTRVRTFLRNYRIPNKFNRMFSKAYIRTIFMVFYKLGIKRGVRRHFWKLLMWTLFRRPRLIPHALTMAIYGAHFMHHFETALE